MIKYVEVREFDYITCNEQYIESKAYHYVNKQTFEQLEQLILETNDDGEGALDFLRLSVRRNVGKVIQARNYVGIIQLKNGFQLQILPKLTHHDDEDPKQTLLKMLRSLKDFPNKSFLEANLQTDRMNIYEIFISMYIREVRMLLKQGLRSAYIPIEDNIRYFKGKLVVGEHLKQNMSHRERFYMRYDEFQLNRPENRLIKSTLLKLQHLSTSFKNVREIRQLLAHFESVEASYHHAQDLALVATDRSMRAYESVMKWTKVFLLNQSFTPLSGSSNAFALLFPMEKLFEAYVAKHLKNALADLDWELSFQHRGYYLFDSPKKFALRPDIVIKREDGSTIVMDTKWKMLTNDPGSNYGISQADMYQMYAYGKKYNVADVWLLYPVNEALNNVDSIQFSSNDGVTVRLFFVDVVRMEQSMGELRDWFSKVL